jgi:hypothetical protein
VVMVVVVVMAEAAALAIMNNLRVAEGRADLPTCGSDHSHLGARTIYYCSPQG